MDHKDVIIQDLRADKKKLTEELEQLKNQPAAADMDKFTTEMIRKSFERVVERLEKYKRANDMCRENAVSANRCESVRYFENLIFATEQAISMVKEEGGIE